ncbi:myotubularin-related protein 7b isoform X5 [Phyllopteryx taeniolatus]|uniref:myotubularin-related protein 7b isoform X5 n=1 Tax=Phyllopteryx taeniolatus TaxID=161469 RepID=UPI002AD46827|nr:myotubularin-related protein 7b isoform X5 [Phyllopteryx taeniolatus]
MEYIRTPKVENVHLLGRSKGQRKASVGTLYLSATHSMFIENNPETRKETWEAVNPLGEGRRDADLEKLGGEEFGDDGVERRTEVHEQDPRVLHSMVSSVERLPTTPAGCQLILRCKDFRIFQLLIQQEKDCFDVHTSLLRLSRPEKYSELYCLSFNPNINKEERQESWNFIDLMADYKRMGVPNNLWVASAANSDYRICETYPSELFIPKSATPTVILGSSRFRSRGRFPALSYFHHDTLAAVCRCSQPLSGFSGRCQEDELMLQAVMKSNPGSAYIYVVDTRPKLNAMANRAAGKGYENEDHYTNIKLHFIGIENIHVMRNSQQKMIDVGEMRSASMTDFLWGLENSGWLKHIKAILDAGVFIAKAVADEGVSVLVHCSDGWDRTAQACSVASVLLDPFYRTIKGMMALIERDWVSFGHKFSHRLHERSHSVWPQLWKDRADFTNPLYKAEQSQCQGVLRPNTTPYCFKMWKGLYNYVERSTPPYQSPADLLSAVREESQQLEEELTNHQERITVLTGKPIMWEKVVVKRRTPHVQQRHCGPDPTTTYTIPVTSPAQDHRSFVPANQNAKVKDPALSLPLGQTIQVKHLNTDDISISSDLESGVADLSSRSSSAGEECKDPETYVLDFTTG